MEGGSFSKLGSRLSAAHVRFKHLQQFQGWRAGGSRLGAAHIRLESLQQLQGWRAVPFQSAALRRLLFKDRVQV